MRNKPKLVYENGGFALLEIIKSRTSGDLSEDEFIIVERDTGWQVPIRLRSRDEAIKEIDRNTKDPTYFYEKYFGEKTPPVYYGAMSPKISLQFAGRERSAIAAHEMGHILSGHKYIGRYKIPGEAIRQEEEAWGKAADMLRKSGKWDKDSKSIAVGKLATYYRDKGLKDAKEKAEEFINNL